LLFLTLSLLADFLLPLVWGLVVTLPIVFVSWWVVYKIEWNYTAIRYQLSGVLIAQPIPTIPRRFAPRNDKKETT